jgi:hypothetical protein
VLISSSSSIGTTTLSWVSACSTVVEHSQQESFTEYRCQRHVKPPTWRRILANTNCYYRLKKTEMGRACGTRWEARMKDAAWKTYARFVDSIKIGIEEVRQVD